MGYVGGPFVIQSGADATTFAQLVQGTIIARDDNNNLIDFTPFRSTSTTCNNIGSEFHVNLHRAQYGFTAEDNKDFSNSPPRVALLDQNNAHFTNNVTSGILQKYLTNAGLGFSGAIGCPTGGFNAGNHGVCPNGGTPGQIFDLFDFADLTNNKMALTGSNGLPLYAAVWAPHWDSTANSSTPPNANERAAAMLNIATFLSQQTEARVRSAHRSEASRAIAARRARRNG